MKRSELKQMIKEEIKKLSEENFKEKKYRSLADYNKDLDKILSLARKIVKSYE